MCDFAVICFFVKLVILIKTDYSFYSELFPKGSINTRSIQLYHLEIRVGLTDRCTTRSKTR